MNVRVRGIYATALTALFRDAGETVVDATPPIRDRFPDDDGVRAGGAHDVAIETTEDRQGVGLRGDPEAVADARDRLADVGIDAFAWDDPAPPGAVFDGEVTETLGAGAVVRLAESADDTVEGYLPYGNADGDVHEGDELRVQVREPAATWGSHRPELDTEIHATGTVATLVPGEGTRVEARDEAAGRELAGMAELLGLEPPAGWGIVWHDTAVDADMDALDDALSELVDRAERIESVLADPVDAPRERVAPLAGAWLWFGRESRFALDERRRQAATTIPGHHRIKAGSGAASAGVDLAEALCAPDPGAEFPFGVVTDQFGPQEGDEVRIVHGKPDGRVIVLGEGAVHELDADGSLEVVREMTPGGTYDELEARREAGDTAHTKFLEGRWWYPTTYRDAEETVKGTYVNVCTPVEVFPDEVRYVDLHVDVVKHADGTVERVDDDLLDEAVAAGDVSEELAEKARSVATALENAI